MPPVNTSQLCSTYPTDHVLRKSEYSSGVFDPYVFVTQQPLTGVDRSVSEVCQSLRAARAARERVQGRPGGPAYCYHSTSQLQVVFEPEPEFQSVERVPFPPNSVVSSPFQRNDLAALGSICEGEGLKCPESIDQLPDISPSWLRSASMVLHMEDTSADLDAGNG